MRSPSRLYAVVDQLFLALQVVSHATARAALAQVVTAVLTAQSLAPAEVARAVLSAPGVPARSRFARRLRALDRPWLTSAHLTPVLVRAVLAVGPSSPKRETCLILDGVRGGSWEGVVVGVSWHGRVLPIAWTALPSPWPKGTFTPAVCALLRRVAACWPPERPVHLVADRGFPSRACFRTLAELGWGFTLRVQARSELTVDGTKRWARDLIAATPKGTWAWYPTATYGVASPTIAGHLVVGRPLPLIPAHQANPGSLRHRDANARTRDRRLARKHRYPTASVETDEWVLLFTTKATARAVIQTYRQRWAIEGSFRDAQGGWDGQHGWDLEPTMAATATAARVDALVGLWALATLLQSLLGAATMATTTPRAIRDEARSWTTTNRLSVWARGRCALCHGSDAMQDWIEATFTAMARRLAAGEPATGAPPTPLHRADPTAHRPPQPLTHAA